MIGAAATLLLASCKSSPKAEERVCNIYGGLQDSVEAILQRHLSLLLVAVWQVQYSRR